MTEAGGLDRRVLLVLASINFIIGMGAFVAVGILSPLAAGFEVSAATAGWVMTAYALVYAPSSPLLVALTGGWDRKSVLLAGLALFGTGAAATAIAPTFPLMLAARGLMAIGGGLVTPVIAAMVVARTEPAHRGRALATVFGGLTLAQVVGVPAGAWLGYAFGWRAAFVAVAVLAACATLVALRWLPAGIAVPRASLAALGRAVSSGWRMTAVAFTVLFLGGVYCLFAFVGPLMEARHGLGRDGVSGILLLFGVGAMVGNVAGGFMTDRIGAARTLVLLTLGQCVILPTIAAVALPLPATLPLILVWSVCGWSFMAPQQIRLATLDPAGTPILLALNAAAIYLGAAGGTFIGGAVIDGGAGFGMIGPAAILFFAAGLVSLWLVPRLRGAAVSS